MDKTNCNKAGMNKTMSYGMKNKTMTGDYNKGMVKTYNSVAALVSSKEMFSTLLAAVKACNLTDALGASFKGTVFAPTNEVSVCCYVYIWHYIYGITQIRLDCIRNMWPHQTSTAYLHRKLGSLNLTMSSTVCTFCALVLALC